MAKKSLGSPALEAARQVDPSPELERPRRNPDETRQKLLGSAAFLFNRDGYHGTDSNKIARHAGFAPGTFYKHFRDKRAALLAVYERWASAEADAISDVLARATGASDLAADLVTLLVETQRSWSGFRSSIRTLANDPELRTLKRDHRARQLDLLAALRERSSGQRRSREQDALLLLTIDRAADALADGEIADLRLSERALVRELEAMLERELVRAR